MQSGVAALFIVTRRLGPAHVSIYLARVSIYLTRVSIYLARVSIYLAHKRTLSAGMAGVRRGWPGPSR